MRKVVGRGRNRVLCVRRSGVVGRSFCALCVRRSGVVGSRMPCHLGLVNIKHIVLCYTYVYVIGSTSSCCTCNNDMYAMLVMIGYNKHIVLCC